MNRWIVPCLVLLLASPAHAYVAIVNKTDHAEIHVVPPPGKVVIDGKLDDWDLSGAITMFIDEASKASYSVRGAMMYDKEFLYIGARVKDPTPMMNNYAFGGEASKAWDADAIQIFLVSNPDLKSNASIQTGGRMSPADQQFVTTFWLWYSTQDKAPGFFSLYTLQYQNPTLNPPGVEKAIVKDEDGKGCTMEYRIPWKVLRTPREIVPGDTMQCQWQLMWGNDRGTATRCGMTDVRRGTSGDLGYMGPSSWGTAIFEKAGNLKLVEKSSSGSRADGFIPISFTLDKPAKVSLAICDAAGKLIRTGLGAKPYPAGSQTWMWDGLDDADKPVPAGSYTAKILTHDGIGQKFVCDVGVSGTPPYQTEDGTGGWAGDYRHPQSMGIDGDCVILGTAIAEAAQPTIRTDLDGRKKFGTAVAGHAVALHKGFGYMLSPGAKITKFNLENGMLAPFSTGRPETAPSGPRAGESNQDWGSRSWQMHGIAVVGDQLVVGSLMEDKLYLLDLASGTPRGEAALPKPYGLAVGPDGGLYAVSGNAVGRYDLKTQQFTAIAKDLDAPKHLAVDAAGNVYVSLHGKAMQVWKIAPDGKVTLKYGVAGGRPQVGKFNPAGMLNPWNVAVDKNGRLWVAEADPQPKRYSVWNADGTLWKDFFGSMDYSTTAYLDLAKPEFIYAQCVRYRVDYEKGTWYPDATILRKREEAGVPLGAPDSHGGATIRTVKGRTFFFVGNLGLTIYEQVGEAFIPRLACYVAVKEEFPLDKDGKPVPNAKPKSVKKPSLWVDEDNDGKVEPEEIRETGAGHQPFWSYMWTPCVDANMNLYRLSGIQWHAQGGAKTTQPYGISRWAFKGFNDKGGLVYGDVSEAATDRDGGAITEGMPDSADGSMYALVSGGSLERGQRPQGSGHRVVMFSPDGKKRWEYQDVHCAFAWTGDAYTPGHLTGAQVFVRGTTPDLVGVTSYYGQYFLLDKQDGLFVDALGEDQRSVYKLDQHMVLTENFNGTMFRHPQNGKTYFLGGDADLRLWELTGLDTMKRQSLRVTVAPEQVAKAAAASKQNFLAGQIAVGKKTAKLPRLTKAAADGTYDEWLKSQPLTICMEGNRTAQAQVGYDETSLHVRFQVGDESPFVNTPSDPRLLFKSGDAVEVNLATNLDKRAVDGRKKQAMMPGDVRIIIARTANGDLVATRYRYVTTAKEKPNTFSVETPSSGKDVLDDVAVWTELPVNASVQKDGYVVEVAIPWKDLGIEPKPGLGLIGDLGVIYGNEGGTKNAIRYLWSDKSPEVSINNDIPSEIRIHPNYWGGWILE